MANSDGLVLQSLVACADGAPIVEIAISTIAQRAGLARRTVYYALDRLQQRGLLDAERRGRGAGRGHRNRYRLTNSASQIANNSAKIAQEMCKISAENNAVNSAENMQDLPPSFPQTPYYPPGYISSNPAAAIRTEISESGGENSQKITATLTADGKRALAMLLRTARHPLALQREVEAILAGARPGTPKHPVAVSVALHDLTVVGGATTPARLRGFVRYAARTLTAPIRSSQPEQTSTRPAAEAISLAQALGAYLARQPVLA